MAATTMMENFCWKSFMSTDVRGLGPIAHIFLDPPMYDDTV